MIDFFYRLLDFLLPFKWADHMFMKNAILAILLLAPLFGILGTMVVNNRMAFFSDALGHGAFTGVALGAVFGIMDPVWAAVLFSLLFAVIITWINNRNENSKDTIIGVFSSTAVALGLVILSKKGSFNKFSSYLIGDLLSITTSEIFTLLIVCIVTMILWAFVFNKLLVVSINRSFASSRGIRSLASDMLFTCSIAVAVTITIQWVGLLLINSMLVLPAAAARNVSSNVRQYHLVSVILSVLSGLTGLMASYYLDTASGATIVLIAAFFFMITFVLRRKYSHI